jgi:hypothetical protein
MKITMKILMIIQIVFLGALSAAEQDPEAKPKVVAKAHSKSYSITQQYSGDFLEVIHFHDVTKEQVELEGNPWPGHYEISPDDKWILRIQKTGSGDNVGILYYVEKNGRVSRIVGFNEAMWKFSDRSSKLKSKQLYHTGIEKMEWDQTSSYILLTVRGSNVEKSGDGIKTSMVYDVAKHTFAYPKKKG